MKCEQEYCIYNKERECRLEKERQLREIQSRWAEQEGGENVSWAEPT